MTAIPFSPGHLYSEQVILAACQAGAIMNPTLAYPDSFHRSANSAFYRVLLGASKTFLSDYAAEHPDHGSASIEALSNSIFAIMEWTDTANMCLWAFDSRQYEPTSNRKHEIWKDIFWSSGNWGQSFKRISQIGNRLKHNGSRLTPIQVLVGDRPHLHYGVVVQTGKSFVLEQHKNVSDRRTGVVSHELKEILYLFHFFSWRLGKRIAQVTKVPRISDRPVSGDRFPVDVLSSLLDIPDLFTERSVETYGNFFHTIDLDRCVMDPKRRKKVPPAPDLKITMVIPNAVAGHKYQLPQL